MSDVHGEELAREKVEALAARAQRMRAHRHSLLTTPAAARRLGIAHVEDVPSLAAFALSSVAYEMHEELIASEGEERRRLGIFQRGVLLGAWVAAIMIEKKEERDEQTL